MLTVSKPPNNFRIQSVNNYYKKCNLKERLLFAKIELDKILKILNFLMKVRLHASMIFQGKIIDAWSLQNSKNSKNQKGSKTDPKNYCQLERIVHEQTMEFYDKHNILYKFQSGFQGRI